MLDEPTSALDPISTLTIEELINDLKKQFTVVIVTHNMQQAARVSDQTAFMYMGDLIEYSDTNTLFTTSIEEENRRLYYWSLRLIRANWLILYKKIRRVFTMDNINVGRHISGQFNEDLERVINHVMNMGGLVEKQLKEAIDAMIEGDENLS